MNFDSFNIIYSNLMKLISTSLIILLFLIFCAKSSEYILTLSCKVVGACSTGWGLFADGGPFSDEYQDCIDTLTCSTLPQNIR